MLYFVNYTFKVQKKKIISIHAYTVFALDIIIVFVFALDIAMRADNNMIILIFNLLFRSNFKNK